MLTDTSLILIHGLNHNAKSAWQDEEETKDEDGNPMTTWFEAALIKDIPGTRIAWFTYEATEVHKVCRFAVLRREARKLLEEILKMREEGGPVGLILSRFTAPLLTWYAETNSVLCCRYWRHPAQNREFDLRRSRTRGSRLSYLSRPLQ